MLSQRPRLRSLLKRQHHLFALLPAVALAGCLGTGGRADNPLGQDESGTEEIEILVRNHNFSQATVYIAPQLGTKRLGIVSGKSDATFKLQWHLPHIQLRVKYLAGREFLPETLAVRPDDLLELQLPAGQQ